MEENIAKDKKKFEMIISRFLSGKYPKIYFIRCNEYVKIGTCSSDLSLRYSELQVGCPYEFEFEGFLSGGQELEQKIHKELKKFKHRGEWYRIEKDKVKEVIRKENGKRQ